MTISPQQHQNRAYVSDDGIENIPLGAALNGAAVAETNNNGLLAVPGNIRKRRESTLAEALNEISNRTKVSVLSANPDTDTQPTTATVNTPMEKFSFFKLPAKQQVSLLLVFFVRQSGIQSSFVFSVVYSCMSPFFPSAALAKGVSESEVGAIFAIYEAAVVVASPIWARLMPVMGARRIYVVGTFGTGVASILFGILQWSPRGTTFLVLCLAIRTFGGCFSAGYLTSEIPILANQFPNHISSVIGLQAVFLSGGFMLGPMIGSLLFTAGGFCTPFFVLGSTCLIMCMAARSALPQIVYEADNIHDAAHGNNIFRRVLEIPIVILVLFCVSNTWSAFAFLYALLSTHLIENFKLTALSIGIWYLIAGVTDFSIAPVIGFVLDSHQWHLQFMFFGLLVSAVGYLAIGPSPLLPFLPVTIPMSLIAMVIIGSVGSVIVVPPAGIIIKRCCQAGLPASSAVHGTIGALLIFSQSCGNLIGPLLGGYLTQVFSFSHAATVFAGMFLLQALMVLFAIWLTKLRA